MRDKLRSARRRLDNPITKIIAPKTNESGQIRFSYQDATTLSRYVTEQGYVVGRDRSARPVS